MLAESGATRQSLGRGLTLVALLALGTVVLVAALVLAMQLRRRARLRSMARDTKQRRLADPWKESAARAETPSADDLYRASGFDKDDTRIEDSPDFGDSGFGEKGPDEPGGWDRGKKPKGPPRES